MPDTLYDKVWASHVALQRPGHPAVLYVDLHLVHEGTYLQAFQTLREWGLPVRRAPLTVATTDHFVPTDPALRTAEGIDRMPYVVRGLMATAAEFGVEVYGPSHERQGIVHVIGPELGLTLPGMTVACGDSHTSTHGALGALAIGIGTTQVGHVLASQCLLLAKQRNLRVTVSGAFGAGVTAKDLALYLLAEHGVEFGRGHVVEFAGPAVTQLSMAGRMTLCNMSIEMGARSSMIAPDDTTIGYLTGRPCAPVGVQWDRAVAYWRTLHSDPDARFDREIRVAAGEIEPMVSYGTTPAMSTAVTGAVPQPPQGGTPEDRRSYAKALEYMGMRPGQPLIGTPVRTVFIGSCTNARIEDLRAAASVLRGRRIAEQTELRVVPGSQGVKRQAEAEGLVDIFRAAGALWGEPSCSMCLGVNGDIAPAGEAVASTSNRNFEGRQGPGARTLLMSPLTAAATAVAGAVADPRAYLRG